MNTPTNDALATLKDLLLLKEELGLLEGKKVTPEQFKRILPKLTKRTEKLARDLEYAEDFLADESMPLDVRDDFKLVMKYMEEANDFLYKLERSLS